MDKKMTLITQVRTEDYCYCKEEYEESVPTFIEEAIAEGVVLNHLTNGEVIMKMFPNNRVDIVMGKVYFFTHDDEDEDFDEFAVFNFDWWNSRWEATYEANN